MAARAKMTRAERAKQFMPFAALKGYEEALQKKEKQTVPKMELSREYEEALDRELRQVQKNDIVTVVYFCKDEYLMQTGMVSGIDKTSGTLCVVNTKILFDDIYSLTREAGTGDFTKEEEV